jgi:hypothetical protein
MKYIEELQSGHCFSSNDVLFLLTSDFRKNGQRLAYSLNAGFPRWFDSKDMVSLSPIYTLDENNNVSPIQNTNSQAIS